MADNSADMPYTRDQLLTLLALTNLHEELPEGRIVLRPDRSHNHRFHWIDTNSPHHLIPDGGPTFFIDSHTGLIYGTSYVVLIHGDYTHHDVFNNITENKPLPDGVWIYQNT